METHKESRAMGEQALPPEQSAADGPGRTGRRMGASRTRPGGDDGDQQRLLTTAERVRHRRELRALEEMASEARRVQAVVFTPSVVNAMSEATRIGRAAEEAATASTRASDTVRSILTTGAAGRRISLPEMVLPGFQTLRALELATNPLSNINILNTRLQEVTAGLSGARTAAMTNALRSGALVKAMDWPQFDGVIAQHGVLESITAGALGPLQKMTIDLSAFQRSVVWPWQERIRSTLRGLQQVQVLPDLRWLEELDRTARRRRIAALTAAKRAREAVLRGDVAAVDYFLEHWLGQRPHRWRHEALVTVLLEADWLLEVNDVEEEQLLEQLRTDVFREGRNHKLIGETQLAGRSVDNLHRPVGEGRLLLDVAGVAHEPEEDTAVEGFVDSRMRSLESGLEPWERRVLLARGATDSETWASAALAVGLTVEAGETVRRKVGRLKKQIADRQAAAQKTRSLLLAGATASRSPSAVSDQWASSKPRSEGPDLH